MRAIAAGKYKNGPFSTTTFVNAIQNRLFDNIIRPFHGHAIVRWPPTTAVDGSILEVVVQSRRLVGVSNGSRKDAEASYFRLVGNTDAAHFITNGSDLSSTTRAVMVFDIGGSRQFVVIIEVMGTFSILSLG